MIHVVYSDLPTFKTLRFGPGLNILLADKEPGAGELQTRNAAGKTSLVEIVHFLLGADCPKDSMFRCETLTDHHFGMEFDVAGSRLDVRRCGEKPSEVLVRGVIPRSIGLRRGTSSSTSIPNSEWRQILGSLIFGLSFEDEATMKNGPTFRSLFSYLARRQRKGGFERPVKNSSMQQVGDQQTAITFLLGLDWTIPQKWQRIRERERTLRELRKAAMEGVFGEVIGSTAELRTRLALAEERSGHLRNSIGRFRVHEEYSTIEVRANDLSAAISRLADSNTLDRALVDQIEDATRSEEPPPLADLERVYKEAGVILPETATRRFEQVRQFHEAIIRNRRLYLDAERGMALRRIQERESAISRLDEQRAGALRILKTHGALGQFIALQEELARTDAEVENLRQRFQSAEQFEGLKTELEIERHALYQRLTQDYAEQAPALTKAIVTFEKFSSALYESPGSLTVEKTLNGPVFDVTIHGERSKGVNNMQMFCFDMMLVQLCVERGIGPGFLVHDSHLFDGVDDRQIASALETGASTADQYGFQYIVTMNSDVLPRPKEFQRYVLPTRLTDDRESGGLFGIPF